MILRWFLGFCSFIRVCVVWFVDRFGVFSFVGYKGLSGYWWFACSCVVCESFVGV